MALQHFSSCDKDQLLLLTLRTDEHYSASLRSQDHRLTLSLLRQNTLDRHRTAAQVFDRDWETTAQDRDWETE